MTDIMAGNSIIKDSSSSCVDAIHTDSILDAIGSSGINGVQTTQSIGMAASAAAQRGFNHVDGTAQRMAIAELNAINSVGDQVCDSSKDNISATERMGLFNNSAIDRVGLFNNNAIERSADKTQGTVERTSARTQDEVEKFGFRELEAISDAEKYLYAGMSQNAKDILLFSADEFQRVKLQAAENTASIKQALCEDTKDILMQACGNTEKMMSQSANQFKDILLQNCKDTGDLKMQAESLGKDAALASCELMRQADKNTAAIQLEAFRHKEELARQIAECCCEQKALTLETAHATQSMIRETEDRRLRDELARTREELLALRIHSDSHHHHHRHGHGHGHSGS